MAGAAGHPVPDKEQNILHCNLWVNKKHNNVCGQLFAADLYGLFSKHRGIIFHKAFVRACLNKIRNLIKSFLCLTRLQDHYLLVEVQFSI